MSQSRVDARVDAVASRGHGGAHTLPIRFFEGVINTADDTVA